MHSPITSPNLSAEQVTGKKPSIETYDKAFDEWALLLFKQYRKKKRDELSEQLDEKQIDN